MSDKCIPIPALFSFAFASNSFFSTLHFQSVCVFSSEMSLCRQHINGLFFQSIQPPFSFDWDMNPFTFFVITDKCVLIFFLLFVFWLFLLLFSAFSSSFSFFLCCLKNFLSVMFGLISYCFLCIYYRLLFCCYAEIHIYPSCNLPLSIYLSIYLSIIYLSIYLFILN